MDKLEYTTKPNYSLYLVTDRNNKKDEEFLKIVEEVF